MSLEHWANLAEIIGVVGLIASLVYVGLQIRQNRRQMQADAAGRYYEWADAVFSRVALSRDFAEIWSKAASELDSLDPVSRERVVSHEIGTLYMWAQWHSLMRDKMLPAHADQAFEWVLQRTAMRQSKREAWKISKFAFDERFRAFAGRYLDDPGSTTGGGGDQPGP